MKKIYILFCLLLLSLSVEAQEKKLDVLAACLSNEGMAPDDYLISKFNDADIILLGEDHGVKENLDFVRNLIPKLYQKGIYMLGMEFGAYEDQAQLDSLINAPEYDEQLARELMFNYNTRWAIVEYMSIYKAAWEWNRSLPEGAKKFRVLNISYCYNWSEFEGARTPENMKKVFPLGNTEDFRCSLLEREVLAFNQKILVLTGTPHAFTFYHFPLYDYTSPGFVRYEERFLGNLLYSKYGERVLSVALHQPFPNYPNHQPVWVSPVAGELEVLMRKANNKAVGFDLKNTPLAKLRDNSYYSMGYTNFTLADLFDGYIFLKPIKELSSCSVDYKFMDEMNWDRAVSNNPDPDWHPRPQSKEQYWEMVESFMNIEKRYVDVQ
ncbi:MAG: ChaN family lipoprotein [Bacteroides sp.]|nr:ChaN family lipoprotein [Bacteroides sp.]